METEKILKTKKYSSPIESLCQGPRRTYGSSGGMLLNVVNQINVGNQYLVYKMFGPDEKMSNLNGH